jgi:excisionase family DNA binding protein
MVLRSEQQEGETMNSNNENNGKSKVLSLHEAATFLNLKPSRIRYEVFKKSIPFLKIGRSIRFLESDLVTWLHGQRHV